MHWLLICSVNAVDVLIIPREMYPSFRHIPEGRWSVFNVTLPSQPYYNVTITFHPLNPTIYLSHVEMIFQPSNWNVSQILTVFATEDDINAILSPYSASFNLSLTSRDYNYDGADIDDYEVTVEDNDDGKQVNYLPYPLRVFCMFCSLLLSIAMYVCFMLVWNRCSV